MSVFGRDIVKHGSSLVQDWAKFQSSLAQDLASLQSCFAPDSASLWSTDGQELTNRSNCTINKQIRFWRRHYLE